MYPVGIGSALKRATQVGDREGAARQWSFWKEAGKCFAILTRYNRVFQIAVELLQISVYIPKTAGITAGYSVEYKKY